MVIRSFRVSAPKTREHVELRSGALRFHITPATSEWQKQRLSTALATLRTVPATQGMTADARKDAIAVFTQQGSDSRDGRWGYAMISRTNSKPMHLG